jgi:DNA mismatch endonuclease (patch repair protein)
MESRSREARSENMRRIRCKDSRPEMEVRRLIHSLGYRYRLHKHSLPGRPDLVFECRRKVVFVHGCFWHAHEHCAAAHRPKSNAHYWNPKLRGNRRRDVRNTAVLRELGWRVLVVWECQVSDVRRLRKTVRSFLGPTKASAATRKMNG